MLAGNASGPVTAPDTIRSHNVNNVMKVAILTSRANSFPHIMAEGLKRLLTSSGIESVIFRDGLWLIARTAPAANGRGAVRQNIRDGMKRAFLAVLKRFDVVVVTAHMPHAFLRNFMDDEVMRYALPDTPIVLYDLVYLPTRGQWAQWLREGNPALGVAQGGNYGMERFDWYLATSAVSEYPLIGTEHPVSLIGLNLDDGTLFPEQPKKFTALLDFEREAHPEERRVQIAALRETGIDFVPLTGKYSISEIRALYRRASVYFIAHRESFGVPICELQACGSHVMTPYSNWVPSHWIKDDLSVPGPGRLTENFVVYRNDFESLKESLLRIRDQFAPADVRRRFLEEQPEYYYGSRQALTAFLDGIQGGSINAGSHLKYVSQGASVAAAVQLNGSVQ